MTEKLLVKDVSHFYGNKAALADVTFNVAAGEFCALLGPNGAGKSTLFALLTRLFISSTGTIEIDGVNLLKRPGLALSKIGVIFQQPTYDLDLTVRQNLNYAAALHGLSGREASDAILGALAQLKMEERIDEKVRSLNGGHRRRMEIARALLHKPEILLLDEATVGLDAETRTMITGYCHELARNHGLAVLWATHLVDEVLPEDKLVILHKGRIIEDGICRDVVGRRKLGDRFAELTGDQAF